MKTETIEKSRLSINMTVKLEESERERIKSLAIAKKRTPHYIMREAIQSYLEQEEAQQRFIAVAKQSLADYRTTGEHITLDELETWTDELKNNPKAPLPLCHK